MDFIFFASFLFYLFIEPFLVEFFSWLGALFVGINFCTFSMYILSKKLYELYDVVLSEIVFHYILIQRVTKTIVVAEIEIVFRD